MLPRASWCLVACLAALAGCSRQPTVACEPVGRYTTATSAPPIQIPDDLSPPNEADALRLPQAGGSSAAPSDRCLESPPPFSTNARVGRDREAESAAPAESPPPQPEPVDPDRVIDN
jgi:uncharacterized lipoprotein